MMYLTCNCTDCIHNTGEDNVEDYHHCKLDYLTISNDTMTSAGFLPLCEDYEERNYDA